jgi:hypothetical protein
MKKFVLPIVFTVAITGHSFCQTLALKWSTDTLLRVPESVLFDAKANILYVSNIDGKSNEKDGKGFISKVSTDGKIEMLQWSSGLDAPKGMGMYKGNLYVADLSRVVIIDLVTGSITNKIEIDGAKFLNDITVDSKGNVFVSDSETGKIHKINDGKAMLYFESAEFKRINGLLALKDGLYVVDAGNGKNYKLTNDKKLSLLTETASGADGIVLVGKDEYVVSSWGGEVYHVDASGRSHKVLDTKEQKLNSADIDYDPKLKIVFVPTFFGNKVMAYEFKNK